MINLAQMSQPAKNSNEAQADHIIRSMKFMLQGETSSIAVCILGAIEDKMPPLDIIQQTQDMINNNYTAMSRMLGALLTERIKSFEP